MLMMAAFLNLKIYRVNQLSMYLVLQDLVLILRAESVNQIKFYLTPRG